MIIIIIIIITYLLLLFSYFVPQNCTNILASVTQTLHFHVTWHVTNKIFDSSILTQGFQLKQDTLAAVPLTCLWTHFAQKKKNIFKAIQNAKRKSGPV